MTKLLSAVAFLLISLTASAQTFSFGSSFPLSNTRYGTAATSPKLVSAGDELYVFWYSATAIRMTHVVDGARRGGLPVLTVSKPYGQIGGFDVVWTGERFVIAAHVSDRYSSRIVTRAVSRSAELSAETPITPHRPGEVAAGSPTLAFNGRTLLLLYSSAIPPGALPEVRTMPLTADGKPNGLPSEFVVIGGRGMNVASNGDGFAALRFSGEQQATLAMFDKDGRLERTVLLPVIEGLADNGIAIEGNGRDYLIVLTGLSETTAIRLTAAGDVASRVTIDTRTPSPYGYGYGDAAATWNGREWVVTYTVSEHRGPWQFVVASLDADVTTVTSREIQEGVKSAGTLATAGGRTVVAWQSQGGYQSVPTFADLPLATSQARELTFMAGEQTLRASATAGDAILVVWSEKLNATSSVRAGIRTSSGDWIEKKLADGNTSVLAATDGNEFVVFLGASRTALFVDRQLHVSRSVKLPFAPEVVTWTGAAYAFVFSVKGALLSPSGAVSAPVTLNSTTDPLPAWPSIASDGTNLLVAWATDPQCLVIGFCPNSLGVTAARFGPDLTRLDVNDLVLTSGEEIFGPAAAWNGKEFVVTWTDGTRGQFAAMVPTTGTSIRTTQLSTHTRVEEPRILAAHGGVVVTGRDYSRVEKHVDRLIFLSGLDRVTEGQPFEHSGVVVTATEVQVIGGRLAYLASKAIEAPPQHAASHVTMTLEVPGARPGSPQITAADISGQTLRLQWTAASGPVTGYRLEYRLGDGAWNEVEKWFPPDERQTTFRMSPPDRRSAFRVRAWSDAGTGAYSAPAYVNPPRRRAVR